MKKSAGFTLIELVIVIIILGILGAVAAPRLFNLQGDAYGANLNALRSSISTAATMANAKAQISGEGLAATNSNPVPGYKENGLEKDIAFVYGYPIAEKTNENAVTNEAKGTGILATLDGFEYERYKLSTSEAGVLTIIPKAVTLGDNEKCEVIYKQATSTSPAVVEANTDDC